MISNQDDCIGSIGNFMMIKVAVMCMLSELLVVGLSNLGNIWVILK